MKGEEGSPEVASIDKSVEHGCTINGISTTDVEQSEQDFGAPLAKRGRGRPPKNPQQQPSSNPVGDSKYETKENAYNSDAPRPMKSYSCASCDFVTSSRTMLKKHAAANHSSDKTAAKAECGICGYKGRNEVVLRIHYRKMHSAI